MKFDPQGVIDFSMFSFDCGKLFDDESLDGVDLYSINKINRTGLDNEAMSDVELKQRQAAEREDRAERMRQMVELLGGDHEEGRGYNTDNLEQADISVCDLIGEPKYVS
jgi:hypothetical protein